MKNVLNPGSTLKTWIEPENVEKSGIDYNPDDFEWHMESYQYIDGTKTKINNDYNLNNNSEERVDYGGGIYLSYHIFNQTIAVTSGFKNKEYDILIWVTLESDPSIGSNIITLRCRPNN